MEVRPFLTAGVAIASAGVLVAALPAIAPPLAADDVKVYADPNMKLAADLETLINVFFKSSPGDPDAPGTIGFPGIVFQQLRDANAADPRGQAVIDAFFADGGFSEVVQLLLTRDYPPNDPTAAQINAFFDGGVSELVRLRLLMSTNDPTQIAWINKFFGGEVNDDGDPNLSQQGFPGTFYKFLSERGLSPDQQRQLDIFWNRAQPVLDEEGEPVLDENGNPVFVGTSNPALKGFPGLFYYNLRATGLSPDQERTLDDLFVNGGFSEVVRTRLLASTSDETQKTQIDRFFDGGATQLVGENLLDANGDPTSAQYQAINSFFFGYPFGDDENDPGPAGFVGLAHFIIDNLMGNVPPPVEEAVQEFSVLADTGAPEVKSPQVNELPQNGPSIQMRVAAPAEPGDVVDDLVDGGAAAVDQTAQALGSLAPPAPAALPPAPVAAPAPAPETKPVVDEKDDAKIVTEEEMNSGNMAESPVILFQNGGGGGGSAWENESLPRWRDAFNRLGIGGGAPAPAPSAPEAGAEGGAEAGAEG